MLNLELQDCDYDFTDDDFIDDSIIFLGVYNDMDLDTEEVIWQFPDELFLYEEPMCPSCDILTDEITSIENINFRMTESGNYRVQSKYDMFSEQYYFEPKQMFDGTFYDTFITATEKCIRTSMIYKAYISYLKNEIGLIYDAFNSSINHDVATIEFHHGPIFTLYDYVKIMIDYAFDTNIPVTTFNIARLVMNEHACNRIQGVMLTKNNHKLVHANKLQVDLRMCHGNLTEFIQLYSKYIKRSPKLVKKINAYKMCIESGEILNTSFIQPSKVLDWSIETPYDSTQ